MATQQRKKPASRTAAKRPSASRTRSPAKSGGATASRQAIGSVMAGHRADVWGIGLVLLGLLTGFASWFGAAGVVGDALDDGLALTLGLSRAVVPVALVAGGVVLIRGGTGNAEDDSERIARVVVGGVLVAVAVTAVLHVVRGRPGIDDPVEEIGAAGGVALSLIHI